MSDTAIETATPGTALAKIEQMTALQVFEPGAIDPLLDEIAREVRGANLDVSTLAGRKAIASLAYKVARTKTFLDDMGKDLVGEWKARSNKVDAERRKIRERLDDLRDEARKPLDDFERAEEVRINAHEAAMAAIPEAPGYGAAETAAEIGQRLAGLRAMPVRDWQEFAARAAQTIAAEIDRTERLLAAAQKREADAAELERLRKEAVEAERTRLDNERREREATIARQAAEDARVAAEIKAQEEARAEAARVEAERKRLEAERVAAEERAARAERDRVAAEEKAEADRIEALAQSERDRVAAVEAERKRAEAERAAEAVATAKREADKKHRATINRAALAALIEAGLSEAAAKTAVEAIARGAIPNVAISY